MKETEQQLDRLFRAARQAPDQEAAAMPVHLKARVLAHWRAADPDALMATAVAALFRRALVCAAVVMVVCVAWSYADSTLDMDDDDAIVDTVLTAVSMP